MQKHTYRACGAEQYTADTTGQVRCKCGAHLEENHEICVGCKRNHGFFERYCEGISNSEEWTLRRCEEKRARAKEKWQEAVLSG